MMNMNMNKPYPTTATRRRTHLKPSQVAVLQETFVTNTLPDAALRCQLAQELGVSERTVQIWFQNRRAKARKLEASSPGGPLPSLVPDVRTGWIQPLHHQQSLKRQHTQLDQQPHILPQHYQPAAAFRSYLTTPEYHQHEPNSKRRPRSCSKPERLNSTAFMLSTPPPHRAMSEGVSRAETTNQDKYVVTKPIVTIPVHGIRIGTWARFARQILHTGEWDLICFSDPSLRQLIWQVQDGGHLFRIEVSFDHVQQICLGQIQPEIGQLDIDINPNATISFSMRRNGVDQDWVRCNDFTENQQASHPELGPHALQGSHDALRQSLLELISQAPDLAGKLVILPDTTNNPLCRDITMSPSATPEPSAAQYFVAQPLPNGVATTANWMLDTTKNPWNCTSFYPPQAMQQQDHLSNYDQTNSWTYLNMLQNHNSSSTTAESLNSAGTTATTSSTTTASANNQDDVLLNTFI